MPRHSAWMLDLGSAKCAVGERELLHIIYMPKIFETPNTPRHCRHVLFWENRIVPVVDLAVWLQLGEHAAERKFVGIFGHQRVRGEYPQFGALPLAAPPMRVSVDDSQSCALPTYRPEWREIAIACFKHQNNPAPILNLRRVFSDALLPCNLTVKA